ncbi:MAG: hypothetical protein H5T34_01555 [Candidatus Methanomethyliales bacterium]|nr:hypothetical protein [Candidatus Methanomethylicales archaeon]
MLLSLKIKLILGFALTLITIIIALLAPLFYLASMGVIDGGILFWYTVAILVSLTLLSVLYAIFVNRVAFSPLGEIERFFAEMTSTGDLRGSASQAERRSLVSQTQ